MCEDDVWVSKDVHLGVRDDRDNCGDGGGGIGMDVGDGDI